MKITLTDHTEIAREELAGALERALERCGERAGDYARQQCPVDTGRLRASIAHQVLPGEQTVHIGTDVPYAPYVELGTSRSAAQPFLRPSVTEHTVVYRDILRQELERE